MSIKEWLKKWLGIWDLEYRIDKLHHTSIRYGAKVIELERQARVNREPTEKAINNRMDTRSEFSKERQEESNKIGEEALKRLEAEDAARRHTEGKMNG